MERQSSVAYNATYATTYWVILPEGPIPFRLGKPNPNIDTLLTRRGYQDWAFLTAYNPHARPHAKTENQQFHRRLVNEAEGQGWEFALALDISDETKLPAETALFVFGISAEEAKALGQRFGQAGIIVGRIGQAPSFLYAEKK